MTSKTSRKGIRNGDVLFAVTEVVGVVRIDDTADLNPHQAAFLMIAELDRAGDFVFPAPDGSQVTVSVSYDRDTLDLDGRVEGEGSMRV